jgi:hypothetical protein
LGGILWQRSNFQGNWGWNDEFDRVTLSRCSNPRNSPIVRFGDLALQAALEAWRLNPCVRERAAVDNAWFEERVSAKRLATFEAEARGATTQEELRRRHIDYWKTFVTVSEDIPHSFQSALDPADLGSGIIDEYQQIVRVEALWRPLGKWGEAFEKLQEAFNGKDNAVLRGFLEQWNNSNVRDHRPVFAVWRDEVLDEIKADDWAEQLRNRMGLAHYTVEKGPIPVALMEYTVREVKAEAGGVACMFTAPTALDTEPWPYFFPAPQNVPYGRAMALTPIGDEKQLLAEMLHTRITYRPHHIVRLGLINHPYKVHDLKDLRNTHLLAVRIASGREDFGEEIS